MKISDLSISRKVGLLVLLMGIAAGTIATVGSRGLTSLGGALEDTGAREEVAREAMDLRNRVNRAPFGIDLLVLLGGGDCVGIGSE